MWRCQSVNVGTLAIMDLRDTKRLVLLGRKLGLSKERGLNMPNLPPFIAFGNEELKDVLRIGDWIECPHCDDRHRVIGGKRPDGTETDAMLGYRCGDNVWLAGVNGKNTMKG